MYEFYILILWVLSINTMNAVVRLCHMAPAAISPRVVSCQIVVFYVYSLSNLLILHKVFITTHLFFSEMCETRYFYEKKACFLLIIIFLRFNFMYISIILSGFYTKHHNLPCKKRWSKPSLPA